MHKILDSVFLGFKNNLDVVFFIYGFAFIIMGLAIWIQPKKGSNFRLADVLWLLCGFGLSHGVNEWMDMWAIMKGTNPILDIARTFILVISYLFLFEFGRQIFRLDSQKSSFWQRKISQYLFWWLTPLLGIFIFTFGFVLSNSWTIGTTWARYILCFPATIFVAWGLFSYYGYEKEALGRLKIKKYFYGASLSFFIYGVLGGLIVPKGTIFLSSWLNTDSFLRVTHIPVQVFRAICAVTSTWSVIGILRIFEWERVTKLHDEISRRRQAEEALRKAHDELEIKVRERTKELIAANELLKKEIAERRQAEETLKEYAQELEKTNRELDDFNYIVSHDLKEPLRSIEGFSKFIELDYRDRLDETGKDYLGRIRANTTRVFDLIEDLLKISRIERKKNLFEEMEVEEFIDEAKMRLEYAIKQRNAEIIVRGRLPKIFCDRTGLGEVFLNLISNAIKFNDKPAPRIEIGSNLKGLFYEFYVKDNGPGIEEQYFTKIFEIFQRLVKKEDYEGTGAGLTIAKKIVEMHKGRIWLESKIREGTTFYFTIPTEKRIILGKKKIGEILVEKRILTEAELNKILEEQESSQ